LVRSAGAEINFEPSDSGDQESFQRPQKRLRSQVAESDTNSLYCVVISLAEYDIEPSIADIREKMNEHFGKDIIAKRFPFYEWLRLSFAMRQIQTDAKSILDIGTGQGQLINALAHSGRFERVVGIEINEHEHFRVFVEGFERQFMDAEEMTFADDEFDVVLCLEIIEHQPDGKMERVLEQARRVARSQLLVSVPFVEPLPLPAYHHQRFTPSRVCQLFPDATYTLLLKEPVTRVPWLLIDEQ
jgi:SAM-dependent methyltransferase